jgi:hypothetical protein
MRCDQSDRWAHWDLWHPSCPPLDARRQWKGLRAMTWGQLVLTVLVSALTTLAILVWRSRRG